MKTINKVITAALLAYAASPALAQVGPGPCLPTDPPFLAEAPMSAVTAVGLAGTLTTMNVLVTVPDTAPVSTPTATLDMARFADPAPFPGRFLNPPDNTLPTPGFVGGTVTTTGCVKVVNPLDMTRNIYLADNVTSDVNENVLMGVVSENDGTTVKVLGTPVSVLADPRMPGPTDANGNPSWTRLGIPVATASIPLGAPAALEGYFGQDGVLHAWSIDVGGGTPVLPDVAQTGISEWRCGNVGTAGDLRVIGGSYTPPITEPVACGQTLSVVNANNPSIILASGVTVPTVPPSAFCEYVITQKNTTCPAAITVLNSNGSFATTLPNAPANTAPVAVGDTYSTAFNTPLTVVLPGVLANDSDADAGNTLTAVLVSPNSANDGDVEFAPDGSFVYTPALNFSGLDTFTYQAVDSTGATSNLATVTIAVGVPPVTAPVANPDAATVRHATAAVPSSVSIPVLVNDTDLNGDLLSIGTVGTSANGTAVANGNAIVFTPALNFVGTTSFTYTARDASGLESAPATVTVTATNTAPLAANDTATTAAATPVTINVLANDSDPDGDPLTVTNLSPAAAGTGSVTLNATQTAVIYTPSATLNGTVTFTYRASDSFGLTSPLRTISVTVAAPPAQVLVDLDINRFTVPTIGRVGTPLALSMRVTNGGTVNQPRNATVIGTRNGVQIYNRTVSVSAAPGTPATFNFPAYTPNVRGTISWTATIADDNADLDRVFGTTLVTR